MLNTPVFQSIKINNLKGKEKEDIVRLVYLQEKMETANDKKEVLTKQFGSAEYALKKASEDLAFIGKAVSDKVPSVEASMSDISNLYLRDIKSSIDEVSADAFRRGLAIERLTKAQENAGGTRKLMRTESFELNYHNMRGRETSDLWKSTDDFYDLVESKVNDFNQSVGHKAIILRGYTDSATVHFLFAKQDLVKVEEFIPKLMNDIRTDYEQNYIAKKGEGEYLPHYEKSDSTEHPFTLFGVSSKNLFQFYSQHEMVDNTREDWLKAGEGKYGMPDGNKALLNYQSLRVHFVLPDDNEVAKEIANWRSSTFGASVNGSHIERSRNGYERLGRITQQEVLKINPELVAKFEAEDIQRTKDAEAFVYPS
jgi:hypothetical protein